MSFSLNVGLSFENEYVVTKDDATNHLGYPVFATPVMINWMEQVSLTAAKQVLPEGYDTVGTKVNVAHLAATPVGMKVRVIAEVIEVDGKLATFKVKAYDEKNKIGEGTHQRAIIEVKKFLDRIKG